MTNVGLLARLAVASASQQARALALPQQQAEAQQAFVAALREGGTRQEIEDARLRCSAIFEAQLDLCVEAAETQRAYMQETQDG